MLCHHSRNTFKRLFITNFSRSFSTQQQTTSRLSYYNRRLKLEKDIEALPEVIQQSRLIEQLSKSTLKNPLCPKIRYINEEKEKNLTGNILKLTQNQISQIVDAAFITCCLHVESRVAALLGL